VKPRSTFARRSPVALAAAHFRRVDPLEHHRELARIDLHTELAFGAFAHGAEGAGLEPLGDHAESVSVPEEDSDLGRATIEEDEEVAALGLEREVAPHDPRESIEALAHVRRRRRKEEANTRRKRQHRSASAITTRSAVASTTPTTRTVRPERSVISMRPSGALAATGFGSTTGTKRLAVFSRGFFGLGFDRRRSSLFRAEA